jgi:hypothetical protein
MVIERMSQSPLTRYAFVGLVFGMLSVLGVAKAGAQGQTGSIAGVVKDSSGALLPGVTVEASSPVLIEKVRTTVTDGQGQYQIIDLRPGTSTRRTSPRSPPRPGK